MHRRQALQFFIGLVVCPLCPPNNKGFAAGYEGADGPDNWGQLDPANKACSLGAQHEIIKAQLPPLKITWARTADNGRNFRLAQFHFHHPSEHTINGASFPMEVHFVHANTAGNLAVIGVLMTAGKVNKVFNTIVLTMPNREGPAIKADSRIDPNAFLPSKRSYYRYEGSLTTPPCAETANWFVLTESIQVAEPHECASGAEGQPAFRAALVVTWVYQSANAGSKADPICSLRIFPGLTRTGSVLCEFRDRAVSITTCRSRFFALFLTSESRSRLEHGPSAQGVPP
jgi:carbonic anhydrase